MERSTLLGGEHRPDLALDLGAARRRTRRCRSRAAREQVGQQQPRHARLDGGPVVLEISEKPLLGLTREPLGPERQSEHAPPPLRHRMARHHRTDRVALAHAGLDHEAGRGERPGSDARARPTANRRGQRARGRRRSPPARPPRGRWRARASSPTRGPRGAGSPRRGSTSTPRCPYPNAVAGPAARTSSARSACDPERDHLARPVDSEARPPRADTRRRRRIPRNGGPRSRPDRACRSAAGPAR